jgi:hypothetical protein
MMLLQKRRGVWIERWPKARRFAVFETGGKIFCRRFSFRHFCLRDELFAPQNAAFLCRRLEEF